MMSKLEAAFNLMVILLRVAHRRIKASKSKKQNIIIWQLSPKHFIAANDVITVDGGEIVVIFPGLQLPRKKFHLFVIELSDRRRQLVWWNVERNEPMVHKGKQIRVLQMPEVNFRDSGSA